MNPEDLQPISKVGQDQSLGDSPTNPVQYHTHNGIDSPELDLGGVAGNDQEIQFNDNGEQAGDPNFKWNSTNQTLIFAEGVGIQMGEEADGFFVEGNSSFTEPGSAAELNGGVGYPGGEVGIYGGDGAANEDPSEIIDGGDITIEAGEADYNGTAGDINILAGQLNNIGTKGDSGFPGIVTIQAGSSSGKGYGADVYIEAGNPTGDHYLAGSIYLNPGQGVSPNNGAVVITQNSGESYRLVGAAKTTTSSATLLANSAIRLDANLSVLIEARVIARRVGGSGGAAGDSASYVRRAVYKRNGSGVATLVGSIQDSFTAEDQAGWDCTFSVLNNNIYLQVTGATNNTIEWAFEIFFIPSTTSSGIATGVTYYAINEVNLGYEEIYIEEEVTINII